MVASNFDYYSRKTFQFCCHAHSIYSIIQWQKFLFLCSMGKMKTVFSHFILSYCIYLSETTAFYVAWAGKLFLMLLLIHHSLIYFTLASFAEI